MKKSQNLADSDFGLSINKAFSDAVLMLFCFLKQALQCALLRLT